MKVWKYLKENMYIPVSALLVLAVLTIIVNGTYAGYKIYTNEDKNMWGLMLIDSDGSKEYVTNTTRGSVSEDIDNIALLAQKKTAENAAKSLLKSEWLDNYPDAELYVIEVLKIAVNPEKMDKPIKKSGYAIEYGDPDDGIVYYRSAKTKKYYSASYDFGPSRSTVTIFKSEKEAQKVIDMIVNYVRSCESEDDEKRSKWGNRSYSHHFNTYKERNDHLESNMRIVKLD
jgi:hypothetical protein